jgi:type VI secretion system protein ImpB
MFGSTQKKLGQIRPPRVQITYDVEIGDAVAQKALPFVVGVIADLAPNGSQSKERMSDRAFIEVDSESLDKVMSSLKPMLQINVPQRLGADQESLKVEINFNSMDAFNPAQVAKSIPAVAKLLDARAKLNDLLAKLEGNEKLNDLLAEVVLNSDVQQQAFTEAKGRREAASGSSEGEGTPL